MGGRQHTKRMTEKELATRLVQFAISGSRIDSTEYVEANDDPDLKACGNAAIANSLELLGKHRIVTDVQPCFGAGGMGFSFKVNPELANELGTDEAVARHIHAIFDGSLSETSAAIDDLLKDCERVTINSIYCEGPYRHLSESSAGPF